MKMNRRAKSRFDLWNRSSRYAVCCGVFAIALQAIGCGGGHEQATASAGGKVLLDGAQLTSGSVMFTPESGRAAVAQIRPDGTFVLGTYEETDGAIVGLHNVAVFPPQGDIESDAIAGGPRIPDKYYNTASSDLTADVKPGVDNRFTFELSTSP